MLNDAAARIARRRLPFRVGRSGYFNVGQARRRIDYAKNLRRILTPEQLEVIENESNQSTGHGEARP